MNSKSVKEGGKHNMYSKSKRFIASFLAVLMAVCMLPADMLGGVGVVNAEEATLTAATDTGTLSTENPNEVETDTVVTLTATDADGDGDKVTHIVWSTDSSKDLSEATNANLLATLGTWDGTTTKKAGTTATVTISGNTGDSVTLTAVAVKYTEPKDAEGENPAVAEAVAIIKSCKYTFTIVEGGDGEVAAPGAPTAVPATGGSVEVGSTITVSATASDTTGATTTIYTIPSTADGYGDIAVDSPATADLESKGTPGTADADVTVTAPATAGVFEFKAFAKAEKAGKTAYSNVVKFTYTVTEETSNKTSLTGATVKLTLTGASWTDDASTWTTVYSKTAVAPTASVTIKDAAAALDDLTGLELGYEKEGDDGTYAALADGAKPTDAGTYKVIVKPAASSDYKDSAESEPFKITALPLISTDGVGKTTIEVTTTAAAAAPGLTVKVKVNDTAEETLTAADYEVKYKKADTTEYDNVTDIAEGETVTVELTGKGNFDGTVTTTYVATEASANPPSTDSGKYIIDFSKYTTDTFPAEGQLIGDKLKRGAKTGPKVTDYSDNVDVSEAINKPDGWTFVKKTEETPGTNLFAFGGNTVTSNSGRTLSFTTDKAVNVIIGAFSSGDSSGAILDKVINGENSTKRSLIVWNGEGSDSNKFAKPETLEAIDALAGYLTLPTKKLQELSLNLSAGTYSIGADADIYIAYIIIEEIDEAAVAAPTATPATTNVISSAAEVAVGTEVTLSSETEGASFVYAISKNGTVPADSAVTETGAIVLDEAGTTIIKAKATKNGMTDSNIVTFVYKVKEKVAAPTADPATGNDTETATEVTVGREVTISSETEDASIVYAISEDGTVPEDSAVTTTSATGVITLGATGTTIIKAKATKSGMADSDIVTFVYTVKAASDPGDEKPNDVPKDPAVIAANGLWIAGINEAGYAYANGAKITPAVRVYHGNKLLKEKVDYTISYKNNVNVPADGAAENKLPTVVVKGKGNYAGTATKTFVIKPATLTSSNCDSEMAVLANKNGKDLKPLPTVSVLANGKVKKLKNGKDFDVKYYDTTKVNGELKDTDLQDSIKDAGTTYKVHVTGKGNYTGSVDIPLTVLAADSKVVLASKLKVTVAKAEYKKEDAVKQDYAGVKPAVTVKAGSETLTENTDYTLAWSNNTVPGTASVTVVPKAPAQGSEAKFVGTKTVNFKIAGIAIKSCKVDLGDADLTFTGDETTFCNTIKEKLTVKKGATTLDKAGATGVTNPDYTYDVKIDKNNSTKIIVTITGNYAYEGTLEKTFKVKPLDVNDSKVSVVVNYPVAKDGEGDTTPKIPFMKGGAKPTVTAKVGAYELTEGVDYTLSYAKNKAVGTAQIKFKGKGVLKGNKTVDFTIGEKPLQGNVRLVVSNVALNNGGKYDCKPVVLDADGVKLANKKDYELQYFYKAPAAADQPTQVDEEPAAGSNTTPAGYTDITKDINKYKDGVIGGSIIVRANAKGVAYTGYTDEEYKICEKNFTKAKITIAPQTYDGKPVRFDVIKDGKIEGITVDCEGDTNLVAQASKDAGDGYYVDPNSYVKNDKKGTAKVTLIGTGKYAGSKTVSFKIGAKTLAWWTAPVTSGTEALEYIKDAVIGLFN